MATNMKSLNGYGFDASALGGHDPSYYATSEDIQQVRSEIPTELPNPNALTFTGAVSETYDGSAPKSVAIPTVPESLKNPNKLILTGAVTAEYDGSSEVRVEIPSGGGGESIELICDITTTEPVVYMKVDVPNKPYKKLYAYVVFRGLAGESNPDGITLGLRQHMKVQTNAGLIDVDTTVGLINNADTPYWHCNYKFELTPLVAHCNYMRTEGNKNHPGAVKHFMNSALYDMNNYEYVTWIKFSNDNDSKIFMATGSKLLVYGVY